MDLSLQGRMVEVPGQPGDWSERVQLLFHTSLQPVNSIPSGW
jgi:hypothetical protein